MRIPQSSDEMVGQAHFMRVDLWRMICHSVETLRARMDIHTTEPVLLRQEIIELRRQIDLLRLNEHSALREATEMAHALGIGNDIEDT